MISHCLVYLCYRSLEVNTALKDLITLLRQCLAGKGKFKTYYRFIHDIEEKYDILHENTMIITQAKWSNLMQKTVKVKVLIFISIQNYVSCFMSYLLSTSLFIILPVSPIRYIYKELLQPRYCPYTFYTLPYKSHTILYTSYTIRYTRLG